MTTEADLVGLVTFHAVTRYVQRILGVEVENTSAMSSEREAAAHCEAAGLTIETVRRAIMQPAVALASAMGLTHVCTRDFWASLAASGAVTTIYEPYRRETRRSKILSSREMKRNVQRLDRKMKRRPAQCR